LIEKQHIIILKRIQNIIKSISRKKFIDLIPDNVINFIIHKTINNPIFNAQKLIHNIFKTYNISIKKYHLYEILRKNNITYKKAQIKTIPKSINNVETKISDLKKNIVSINNSGDNVVFIDETHVDISFMNTYGWNKIGDEVIFDKNTPNKIINKRVSVIVAVSRNEKINYKIHSDSVDPNKFSSFITSLIAKTDKKYFYLDKDFSYENYTEYIKQNFCDIINI
jgi:hypothetical protein